MVQGSLTEVLLMAESRRTRINNLNTTREKPQRVRITAAHGIRTGNTLELSLAKGRDKHRTAEPITNEKVSLLYDVLWQPQSC